MTYILMPCYVVSYDLQISTGQFQSLHGQQSLAHIAVIVHTVLVHIPYIGWIVTCCHLLLIWRHVHQRNKFSWNQWPKQLATLQNFGLLYQMYWKPYCMEYLVIDSITHPRTMLNWACSHSWNYKSQITVACELEQYRSTRLWHSILWTVFSHWTACSHSHSHCFSYSTYTMYRLNMLSDLNHVYKIATWSSDSSISNLQLRNIKTACTDIAVPAIAQLPTLNCGAAVSPRHWYEWRKTCWGGKCNQVNN